MSNYSDTIKMGNGESIMWSNTYLAIKNKHDEAFKAIEQAITLEEREKTHEAIEKYKEGIKLIDEALNIPVECPENPDDTWQKACVMIQKIKKTRAEVLTRINSIQSAPGFESALPEEPPSYEEAMSSISSSDESSQNLPVVTYKDLATALQELSIDPNQNLHEEIVYMHPGVRLYFISPNGDVLSTQEPQLLKISLVEGSQPNAPKAILQIGGWIYPLVPGVSPCYRTDYGAFILPDVYSDVPGSSVGIILPSDADADVFDLLENILHGIITQETEQEIYEEKRRRLEEQDDPSVRISNKIVNGAWYLSQGLIRGAQKAGDLLNKGTPKLINNLAPAERPAEIPRPVSKGARIAETASRKAVKVTGFVAEKVGEGTMRLGQFLAPHIQKQGTKILSSGFRMSEKEASDKMKGVLTVAAGAVEGFTTIYRGLESSAGILGRSLKENTVKVVEHKYGVAAADTTESSLNTVGNVYYTYQNAKVFKPKGLVKSAAKNTGKSLVHSYSPTYQENKTLMDSLEAGPSKVRPERPPRKKDNPEDQCESDKENDMMEIEEKSENVMDIEKKPPQGLESSAGILGRSLKENTVKVVEHKYGVAAADTTESSLNTVGNVYYTYQNAKVFKPKGLVKSAAKNTGKSLVHSYSPTYQENKTLMDSLEAGPSKVRPERPPRKKDNPEDQCESDKENDMMEIEEKSENVMDIEKKPPQ